MHESLDEFKFRPDTDTNTRVICPCASEKLLYNVVSTLASSFLIGTFYAPNFEKVDGAYCFWSVRGCVRAWVGVSHFLYLL